MFVLTGGASVPCILFSLVGCLSLVLQKENNLEQMESVYSQTNIFLCEQQYAIAWNKLIYNRVQRNSFNT
jgi:nucleoside permease NupC